MVLSRVVDLYEFFPTLTPTPSVPNFPTPTPTPTVENFPTPTLTPEHLKQTSAPEHLKK